MKQLPSGDWTNIYKDYEISLSREKSEMVFRPAYITGPTGPEYQIIIDSK